MKTSQMKQRTHFLPHIHELFAFGVPEFALMTVLCGAALPNLLPLLLASCIALHYWLPNNSYPEGNVQATISGTNAQVEIGGQQHNADWTQRLRNSCAQALRTDVLHDFKNFTIDLRLHPRSGFALDSFRKLLDIVSPKEGASRRHPGIELNVEVQKDDGSGAIEDIVDGVGLNVDHLGSLQKITWRGPHAHFFFTQPPTRSFWDFIFRREKEPVVTFSSLTELLLLGCIVEPQVLAEILTRCPVLTKLEVEHVGSLKDGTQIDSRTKDRQSLDEETPVVTHLHLRHLKISSAVPLGQFFEGVELFNLETLSLDLSPSAIQARAEDDVTRLAIPWFTLKVFELKAPMDYPSFRSFRLFSDREPSRWGRRHTLSDNRTWTRSRCH